MAALKKVIADEFQDELAEERAVAAEEAQQAKLRQAGNASDANVNSTVCVCVLK